MKKQIIAVVAAVALTGGMVLAQDVVTTGPLNVQLTGTITKNDGSKAKVDPVNLQYAQLQFVDGTTNTYSILATSIPTTNIVDIVTSNSVTVLNGSPTGNVVWFTDDNAGVGITKGKSTELVDVFYGYDTNDNFVSVITVDAKIKDDKNGDPTGGSAKVGGLFRVGQSVIKGSLKPAKSK